MTDREDGQMESRRIVLRQTAVILIGQAVGVGVLLGVYALLGKFSLTVLWSALLGALIASANFFFMAVGTSLAADKAENQEVEQGKKLLSTSYLLRNVLMIVILFIAAKSGRFKLLPLLIPLLFVRPTLTVSEIFRKKESGTR